jgi:hypothetical protein
LANLRSDSYGYFLGGYVSGYKDTIDRVSLSTFQTVALKTTLWDSIASARGSSTEEAGYIFGGHITGGTRINTIGKLDFATEVISVVSGQTLSNNCSAGGPMSGVSW